MKILTITPYYDVYIKEFTEALASYVDKITVLVHHNRLTELSNYLPKRGYIRYLERYSKKSILKISNLPSNVTVKLIQLLYFRPDSKNPKLGDRIAKKAEKLIKSEKLDFDIIHAHGTWVSGYAGIKLKEAFNIPVIITTHNIGYSSYPEIVGKEMLNTIPLTVTPNNLYYGISGRLRENFEYALRNADALISVNKRVALKLVEFNNNVFYIPNGFNEKILSLFSQDTAREILNLPKDKKILFSLSYLVPKKGFQYLVPAIKRVIDERDDILCIIGGSGPMWDILQKTIKKLGIANYVKLIGHVNEDKAYWLNATDLFVFPALLEAFGIPVLEALAVGTPVVATINGGSEELITSNDYGLLARPADPEDLAEKILIALERDWNREKIRKYAEQFTWDNIAKQTLDVYKKVLYEEVPGLKFRKN